MTNTTATRPTRQRKPRPKPDRFMRLVNDAETLTCSLVIRQVEAGGKTTIDTYDVEDIGNDTPGARAFALTKQDGTVYNVELDGGSKSCDCKGHTRHGHCKHVDALSKLIALKRL